MPVYFPINNKKKVNPAGFISYPGESWGDKMKWEEQMIPFPWGSMRLYETFDPQASSQQSQRSLWTGSIFLANHFLCVI